tara:strand:+ start:5401 stop:5844 length:444 start_codon:yes stop_codon:yes gene_type:complete
VHAYAEESNDCRVVDEPSDEAVKAYMKRNANKYVISLTSTQQTHASVLADSCGCSRLRAMMERMAERLPTSVEVDHESQEHQIHEAAAMPTTLRAAIRIFPQAKQLREDLQEINIAVEVEGVLHNRQTLVNATVDVVFVVDNGYVLM